MNGLGKLSVVPHPVAVAPDVDDLATVQEAVQQGSRHNFVVQDLSPLLKALVRGQHRRGASVPAADQLEE